MSSSVQALAVRGGLHEDPEETQRGFSIGPVRIDPPVMLAPMADVTNGAFRRLVKRIGGPGLLVTELISTTAIHYKSARTMTMFDVTEDQRPLAVQLFGSDPDVMAEAARVAEGEGADIIDINMGCWVPKVCKTGGGAAMMRDEATACRAVEAIRAAVSLPVTVKTRAGWDYGHFASVGFARSLEIAGISAFTLHARYAVQGHTGEADWDLIRAVKQAIRCPVIGNGDIRSPEDAVRMVHETGCDGVMIGRAAIGNPWIVRDSVAMLRGQPVLAPPTLRERADTALTHLLDLSTVMGEPRAVRHLRGQLPLYARGFPGAARLRDGMMRAETIAEVRALFEACETQLPITEPPIVCECTA